MSKHGVRLLPNKDGGYSLEFDNTPYGRALSRHHAAVGEPLRQTYIATYDDNHNRIFSKDKKIDQYARIQSFKDQCLIENIIKRCVGGDYSGLNRMQGMYGDFTGIPNDPRYAHDLLGRAKEVFDSLGAQERKSDFADDFETFLGTFGNNKALADYIQSKRVTSTETEVPADGKE